jgi:hypothetical protein
MRKSTKALLLSVLVFPGAGQLVLERKLLGYSLITVASAATLTIFHYVLTSALYIVERVTAGEVPPDFFMIRRLVSEQQAASDVTSLNLAVWVLVISWLVGILDVWRRSRTLTP